MHVLHSKSNKISMELYQKHQTYFKFFMVYIYNQTQTSKSQVM